MSNTAVGVDALGFNITGSYNLALGYSSLANNTGGLGNTAVGVAAGSSAQGDYNVFTGYAAGQSATGSGNIFLGHAAGAHETGSNSFYIDNQDRTNTAGDKANALLYGTFANSAIDQVLRINGNVGIGAAPVGKLDVNSQVKGKALTIFNETGDQAIFTASAAGTTRFTIANNGDVAQTSTETTGTAYALTGNSLTTGNGLSISSTSTGFTTGKLASIDWSPGSSTTATGDLVRINIGPNGTIGNLFNVTDNGSTLFSVSESQITMNLPTQFTAAGDVAIAYDLNFTNQTASYIKSYGPLSMQSGESFESNNLTLEAYNSGKILMNVVNGTGGVGVGAGISPNGFFEVSGQKAGQALVQLNETGNQDVLTASVSGTTKLRVDNSGDVLSAGYFSGLNSTTTLRASGTVLGQSGSGSIVFQDSSGTIKGRLDTTKSGLNLGDGSDGAYSTSSAGINFNNDTAPYFGNEPVGSTANSGQTVVPVGNTWHLSANDEVLLMQMTGVGAGSYEFRRISSVSTNTSITLDESLTHSYVQDSTSAAQIVEVPQFTDVTITGTGWISGRGWTGQKGGILIFRATGTVNCTSSATDCISVSGDGFRGGVSQDGATATQGEGIGGSQSASTSRKYNAGGGGGAGTTGGGGGGGAGTRHSGTSATVGGGGGRTINVELDLSRLYLGAGGGGGGDDTDVAGIQGGIGDSGGGIMFIEANTMIFAAGSGGLDAQGATGDPGTANDGGGGGGGGGGTVWLRGDTMSFDNSSTSPYINTSGGSAGAASGAGGAGAVGGSGAIKVQVRNLTGGVMDTDYVFGGVGNTYGTLHIGKINTEAADLAELYQSEDALEPGDIVTMDRDVVDPKIDPKFAITKSQKADAMPVMGAISTKPGVILGSLDFDDTYKTFPVALKGRTPVKVVSTGGIIHKGDPIGLSAIKGYGMKPEKQGYIVGYALEEFNPENGTPCPSDATMNPDGSAPSCGSIMAYMQQELYDPKALVLSAFTDEALSALRFEEIKQSSVSGVFSFSETVQKFAHDAIAATNGFFINLKAGKLDVGELRIGGKTLKEYIQEVISSSESPVSSPDVTSNVASSSGQLSLSSYIVATDSGITLGAMQEQPVASVSSDLSLASSDSASPSASFVSQLFSLIQSLRVRGEAFFEGISTFIGKTVFKSSVTVEDSILFPSNMGGTFVIPTYISKVRVSFDKPFESTPSVSLTPVLSSASDSAYLSDAAAIGIADVTTEGFTAVLDYPLMHDMTYSFTALQVLTGKITQTQALYSTLDVLGATVSANMEIIPEATSSAFDNSVR